MQRRLVDQFSTTLVPFCSVRVRCLFLAATGRPVWEAGLQCLQHLYGEPVSMTPIMFGTTLHSCLIVVGVRGVVFFRADRGT